MRCLPILSLVAVLTCTSLVAAAEPPYGLERRFPCDTSRLQGTPEPPPPYRTRRVFDRLRFDRPVHLFAEPGSKRLIVVQLGGKAVAFANRPAIDKTAPYLDLPDHEMYSLAFHPQYATNNQVFVFANGVTGDPKFPRNNRIYRYEAVGSPRRCDPKSRKLVIEWASNGHNGGDLGFGPDGMLYITSGDGTSDSDGDVTGQDLRDLCSGALRIDVDHPAPGKGYSVPPDNPFLKIKDAKPELYAFGFRNPWRMTLDRKTGTFWIGDVGQDLWEMIHVLRRGGNYGWSVYEGGQPFYPTRQLGPGPYIKPAQVHHHSESRSITGGQFYTGKRFKELQDVYIYGDYATGKIWGLRHENGVVNWRKDLANTRLQMVGFGLDHQGEIYIVDHGGSIHTFEPAPPPTVKHDFPRRLSETGLFANVAKHQPQPGLIPYSVNAALWSDGAYKERFIALPGMQKIEFSEEGFWRFPEGTVLVKSFSLEREPGNVASRRRIETRLLVFQQNEWQGYSYQWLDDQSDAVLVAAGGADKLFQISDRAAGARQQTWRYPSRVECMVCHSRAANYVLGLTTMQMNKVHDYGKVKDNQLRTLAHVGAFRGPAPDHLTTFETRLETVEKFIAASLPDMVRHDLLAPVRARIQKRWDPMRKEIEVRLAETVGVTLKPTAQYKKLTDPDDVRADINLRARSYLQANCAHCHVWAGGGNSAVDLHFNTSPENMRLIGAKPLHDAFGLTNAKLVTPGAPERSVLFHRVSTTGRGRMPPLASSVVDHAAVRLLDAWIRQVKPAPPPKVAGGAAGLMIQVVTAARTKTSGAPPGR